MNNNSNKIEKNTEKENVHRHNCECACVLCTDEGLMSYLQMCSTGVCYVLFRWDTAWGEKLFLCLAVFVLSDL